MGTILIGTPDRGKAVLVRALLEQYGEAAAEKAKARSGALSELGDAAGAAMWLQVAEMIVRGKSG